MSSADRSRLEALVNSILANMRNELLSVTDSISGLRVMLNALDTLLDSMLKKMPPSSHEESREMMSVFFHAVRVLMPYLGSISTLADIVEEAYSRVERAGEQSRWIYPSLAKQISSQFRELHEMMYRSLTSECRESIDGGNLVVTAIGFSEETIACLMSISDSIYEVIVPVDEVMRSGLRLRKKVRELSPELGRKVRLTVDSTVLYMVRHSNYLVTSASFIRPDGTAIVPTLSYLPLRAASRYGVKTVIPTYSWNFMPDNRDYGPLPRRKYVMGEGFKDVSVPLFEAVMLDEEKLIVTEEDSFYWGSKDISSLATQFRNRILESVMRVGYEAS